ncbi:histidine kinase/DNA gyrase B/HSP90-like ATPase [Rhizobium subbaraonis]|uniref:histidine kinase n=1 Tax=Rhizobium subbaraonis TaxID=908946 RepID=A0A285U4T8_9HYPH|nr:histidine kinase/DNA gyrase B/HSP90-like ATPase [Rhizobium subbaraonis]
MLKTHSTRSISITAAVLTATAIRRRAAMLAFATASALVLAIPFAATVRAEPAATGFVRTELQQVVVNLVVNAIHAMPDGGRLTIVTRDGERSGRTGVEIVVSDTGVGMAADVVAKAFDPFFTTKRQEGTGLGLSISQTLVTRQGGAISATSSPGSGASFTIWLPEAA